MSKLKSFLNFFRQETRNNLLLSNQMSDFKNIGTREDLNPTSYFRLESSYDFSLSSPLNLLFLDRYAQSDSKNFVLSKFKYIIQKQWDEMFFEIIIYSVGNWLHVVLFSLIMLQHNLVLVILDYFILAIVILHEILSYLVTKSNYFKDISNYYDIATIILSLFCLTSLCMGNELYKEVKFIALVAIHVRTIFYFKIFKPFRYLIYMFVEVVKGAFTTFVLIAYVILVFSLLKYSIMPDEKRPPLG